MEHSDWNGTLTAVNPAEACTPLTTNMTGAICLIERGVCDFQLKTLNCQYAGGIGAIIGNAWDTLTIMAGDGTYLNYI